MFSNSVQPSIMSLFSSTGSDPLQLFETHLDASLTADSSIHLLHDTKSLPLPAAPTMIISPPTMNNDSDDVGYGLNQTVLQIQSPTLRTTYIHCPPAGGPGHSGPPRGARDKSNDLGIRHPWMHLQIRNMGREWSFEVGIVDQSNRMGIIRLSTFQKQPRLKLSSTMDAYPLLHLPLSFPPSSSRPLTAWSTVTLCLPSYLPYFSSPNLINQGDGSVDDDSNVRSLRMNSSGAIPSGSYSHVAYVRIYATCRLRRIWFDEAGPGQKVPWEFELYGNA
ncbi:hypothetical protein BDZ94DRAFT_1184808 [Collybia nuda]|uniref:CFA20 domain-containing protein n=1 Tax=Collybia nuda TaxID=64659 RepID=A0A9P6CIM4_9AGAR|nr:hypothetical protein BDZ94DRAFT_1184808 [Collybia nuda]